MALAGLCADLLAERGEPLGRPAVGDVSSMPGSASRMQATCVRAWWPQPITPSVRAPGLARYFAATALAAPGAELPEPVGLDQRTQLAALEQHDDEADAVRAGRVGLHAGEPALVVDRGHHREEPALERDAVARDVLDRAGVQPQERVLDRGDRVGRREQPVDVGFCQREGRPESRRAGLLLRDDADLAARLQHGPGDGVDRGDLLLPGLRPSPPRA